jgi:hypothetical protein
MFKKFSKIQWFFCLGKPFVKNHLEFLFIKLSPTIIRTTAYRIIRIAINEILFFINKSIGIKIQKKHWF